MPLQRHALHDGHGALARRQVARDPLAGVFVAKRVAPIIRHRKQIIFKRVATNPTST